MSAAEPQRGTILTRKLAACAHCGDMIFETHNGWQHNRTGQPGCGAAPIEPLALIKREKEAQ